MIYMPGFLFSLPSSLFQQHGETEHAAASSEITAKSLSSSSLPLTHLNLCSPNLASGRNKVTANGAGAEREGELEEEDEVPLFFFVFS